jgi:hypothetical protein
MPIALANWLEHQRRFWETSLDRLAQFFDKPRRRKRKN